MFVFCLFTSVQVWIWSLCSNHFAIFCFRCWFSAQFFVPYFAYLQQFTAKKHDCNSLHELPWTMRNKCKILIACVVILLFVIFTTLQHIDFAITFAQVIDYIGLPSTLYMPNISCSGCNRFNAAYIIEPRRTSYCTYDKPIFLMILVISKPDNFDRRLAIRRSWGSISAHDGKSIRTFFVCGRTANNTLQVSLETEAKQWIDVLQVCSLT